MLTFQMANGRRGAVSPWEVVWLEERADCVVIHLRNGEYLAAASSISDLTQQLAYLLASIPRPG